jgi:YD repeat-containing protein
MKTIIVSILLLGLLSCHKAIDVVLVNPPVFQTTCLLKRTANGSDGMVDGKKNIEETTYEYDGNNNLTATQYRSEYIDDSLNINSQYIAKVIYMYDSNGFLTETSGTLKGIINGILKGTVSFNDTYQYQNDKLALKRYISKPVQPNRLEFEPQDITQTYQYEGEDLVSYKWINNYTYHETNISIIKNGRLVQYDTKSDLKENTIYELDAQGFMSKRETTYPNSSGKDTFTYQYDDKGRRISDEFNNGTTRQIQTYVYDNNPSVSVASAKFKGHPFVPSPYGYGGSYNSLSQTFVRFDAAGKKEIDNTTFVAKYNYNSAGLPIEKLDANGKVVQTYEYVNCK